MKNIFTPVIILIFCALSFMLNEAAAGGVERGVADKTFQTQFCTKCGRGYSNETAFCSACGGNLKIKETGGNIVKCPKCNKVYSTKNNFCPQDGTRFTGAGSPDMESTRPDREEMMSIIIKELGLSPDQQKKIEECQKQHKEQKNAIEEKQKAKREELRKELEKETLDRQKINSIVEDSKKLMGEELDERIKTILYIREVMTPEQFKKLGEKRKELREKMKDNK